jgi:hypothetical protein
MRDRIGCYRLSAWPPAARSTVIAIVLVIRPGLTRAKADGPWPETRMAVFLVTKPVPATVVPVIARITPVGTQVGMIGLIGAIASLPVNGTV